MKSLYKLSLNFAKKQQREEGLKYKDLHDEYLALSKQVQKRKSEILDLIKAFEYLHALSFKGKTLKVPHMLGQLQEDRLPYPLISYNIFGSYTFMGIAMKDARLYDDNKFDCGVVVVIRRIKNKLVIELRYNRNGYNLHYDDSKDDWTVNAAAYKIRNVLLTALLDHLDETIERVRTFLEAKIC